jgi:hypothetical protein
MSCRRVCRELLWLARFGELGPDSQPHLDHLAGCRGCRDEVGFDREMVRQLRVALAARVEGLQPSPSAWEGILRRAQASEPSRAASWWQRSVGLVGRLRTATAIASTGLALVLALNMEVVTISRPAPADTSVSNPDLSMLEEPQPYAATLAEADAATRPAVVVGRPHPEATIVLPPPRGGSRDDAAEPADAAPPGELVVLDVRFTTERSGPEASSDAGGGTDEAASDEPAAEPLPQPSAPEPGQPS